MAYARSEWAARPLGESHVNGARSVPKSLLDHAPYRQAFTADTGLPAMNPVPLDVRAQVVESYVS